MHQHKSFLFFLKKKKKKVFIYLTASGWVLVAVLRLSFPKACGFPGSGDADQA